MPFSYSFSKKQKFAIGTIISLIAAGILGGIYAGLRGSKHEGKPGPHINDGFDPLADIDSIYDVIENITPNGTGPNMTVPRGTTVSLQLNGSHSYQLIDGQGNWTLEDAMLNITRDAAFKSGNYSAILEVSNGNSVINLPFYLNESNNAPTFNITNASLENVMLGGQDFVAASAEQIGFLYADIDPADFDTKNMTLEIENVTWNGENVTDVEFYLDENWNVRAKALNGTDAENVSNRAYNFTFVLKDGENATSERRNLLLNLTNTAPVLGNVTFFETIDEKENIFKVNYEGSFDLQLGNNTPVYFVLYDKFGNRTFEQLLEGPNATVNASGLEAGFYTPALVARDTKGLEDEKPLLKLGGVVQIYNESAVQPEPAKDLPARIDLGFEQLDAAVRAYSINITGNNSVSAIGLKQNMSVEAYNLNTDETKRITLSYNKELDAWDTFSIEDWSAGTWLLKGNASYGNDSFVLEDILGPKTNTITIVNDLEAPSIDTALTFHKQDRAIDVQILDLDDNFDGPENMSYKLNLVNTATSEKASFDLEYRSGAFQRVDASGLSEGPWIGSVSLTDASGNVGYESNIDARNQILIDLTPPHVDLGLRFNDNNTLEIYGSASDDWDTNVSVSYDVFVDGQYWKSGNFKDKPIFENVNRTFAGKTVSVIPTAIDDSGNVGLDVNLYNNAAIGPDNLLNWKIQNLTALNQIIDTMTWDNVSLFINPTDYAKWMSNDSAYTLNLTAAPIEIKYDGGDNITIKVQYVPQNWTGDVSQIRSYEVSGEGITKAFAEDMFAIAHKD